jgi:protein ImuB
VLVKTRPDLRFAPVALIGGSPSRVVTCSRAAREAGIAPGMEVAVARAAAPRLSVVTGGSAWRAELESVREALAVVATVEDVGPATADEVPGGCWIWLVVAAGTKSSRFGRQVLGALERAGYRGRIGIAADRFTAWAAARSGGESVAVVPRHSAAAFLAPLPLDLLPLGCELRATLHAAGVHTLGEFASLPPPSVGRAAAAGRGGAAAEAIDYWALARGRGPLRPASPPSSRSIAAR